MGFRKITESDSVHNNLEKLNTISLLKGINEEDQKVPRAIEAILPQIEKFIDSAFEKMKNGGRLFYIGAGTSGRLGIVDASECPPTFGVSHDLVIGLIAGGDGAIRKAVEFAEDDEPLEDGLQLAGNIYYVIAKYEEGIKKLIDESGVLRSLAVLMKSKNSSTRSNAWEVLKDACQHPCQNRLMEENFLNTLKSMKVQASLQIAQNIGALLSSLSRDKNIRRIIFKIFLA